MRKLFWQVITSLDGFVEGPNRELDWFTVDADFNHYVDGMLASIDTILFGRVTYEALASYWPTSTDAEAPMMNALPKVVFSRTLDRVDWQSSRLATADVVDEVTALKRRPGKDLALFASADLASTLVRHGLIDEYRVIVMPILLGGGRPMLRDAGPRRAMELVSTQTLGSGAVILTQRPRD